MSHLPSKTKYLVLGRGISGQAAARLLDHLKRPYDLWDAKNNGDRSPSEKCQKSSLCEEHVGDLPDDLSAYTEAVVSPGLPVDHPVLHQLRAAGVACISEIEFGWRHRPEGTRVIAITGSMGKSTLVKAAADILNQAGISAVPGGNYGTAASELALLARQNPQEAPEVWVLECSSFQLETVQDFHPEAALLIGLQPNHLDRHGNMHAYAAAKARIFENIASNPETNNAWVSLEAWRHLPKEIRSKTKIYAENTVATWPATQWQEFLKPCHSMADSVSTKKGAQKGTESFLPDLIQEATSKIEAIFEPHASEQVRLAKKMGTGHFYPKGSYQKGSDTFSESIPKKGTESFPQKGSDTFIDEALPPKGSDTFYVGSNEASMENSIEKGTESFLPPDEALPQTAQTPKGSDTFYAAKKGSDTFNVENGTEKGTESFPPLDEIPPQAQEGSDTFIPKKGTESFLPLDEALQQKGSDTFIGQTAEQTTEQSHEDAEWQLELHKTHFDNTLLGYNMCGLAALLARFGISVQAIRAGLESFSPLPHRLQSVASHLGAHWINDSKATSAEAMLGSISMVETSGMTGKLHLIVGGRTKEKNVESWKDFLANSRWSVYFIGELSSLVQEKGMTMADANARHCSTVSNAVAQCAKQVKSGDIVLFSPGCASFDQFENYEERGLCFIDCVNSLTTNIGDSTC